MTDLYHPLTDLPLPGTLEPACPAPALLAPAPVAGQMERVRFVDAAGAGITEVLAGLATGPRPDVLVLDGSADELAAVALAERLNAAHPDIILVVVAEPSADLLEIALEAGVRHVVRVGAGPAELQATVGRALARVDRRSSPVIDLREPPAPVAPTPAPTGRIITVLSPKGGSGKTTIATNLACGLSLIHPGQVVIVDLDLQFGDVADSLLLDPHHTMAGLPADPADVDGAELKLLLVERQGLYALCPPDDPVAGEEVPLPSVHAAIRALSLDLPYVVVDTGAGIDAAALGAIEMSTDLVLVGSLDVPSIRSARKLLDVLRRLDVTEPQIHVVLNRSNSRVGIDVSDASSALGLPIAVQVPSSRAIPTSVNFGTPVIASDPRAEVSAQLRGLVARFTDTATAPGRRRGLLRRRAR